MNPKQHLIISSVVDCLLNPLAIRISSVVLCRLMAGACDEGGWEDGGGRVQGDGSLEEHVLELSGDLDD